MHGQLTVIDLKECDKKLVRDKKELERFLRKICNVINMKAYGNPLIKRFGKDRLRGYTGLQLIETSNIVVHLDEYENKVFIDIFSCKDFDAIKAKQFSKQFFKANKVKSRTIIRK